MPGTPRRPRADAQRNRDRLLDVAVRALSTDAHVPLEQIARDAGVGIGTLYRHFPTRAALVEAAYRNELARLCDGVPALLERQPPVQALRTWMDRFVAYMTTKRGMADALREVIASGGNPYEQSRARLTAAIDELLQAGQATRALRTDVPAVDVLTGLNGVALAAGAPEQREQAGRLLDLLVDGLRHRATS